MMVSISPLPYLTAVCGGASRRLLCTVLGIVVTWAAAPPAVSNKIALTMRALLVVSNKQACACRAESGEYGP